MIDILYYSKKDLIDNSLIYKPLVNPKDLNSFLEQVSGDLYSQEGQKVGNIYFLNSANNIQSNGLIMGLANLVTEKGIISWINSYSIGSSKEAYLPTSTTNL